ncbi:T9SS type A sorting domain-containing protein [Lewinella sp. 4G2]|uniref:T9SS type A sorting domain-containing protein n=1 Tax=Lewinella sp. 4G2 TaxID=1803372 RepID=UPI0007B4BD56|nr:T9SS type A sorting domain-containing protein [Lewinella sp. 4G2]OAV44714.1 hypothetical protein A3850_009520 [Lewinella sp. 4G2]
MQPKLTFFVFLLLLGTALSAQTVRVTDADLVGGQTYNWDANTTYILDGLVFLEAGGVLNIPAGTVIKGSRQSQITTGDNTSALIIARGAQIFAEGTAEAPIVFTAERDDLSDDFDMDIEFDRGQWGGLIILGNATIARPGGEDGIEGIDAGNDSAKFGGDNDNDNSGTLTYVSIRYGGSALSPNNEINGLTLGGVGSGTTIDYVEVYGNLDDGIEFFGGTVKVDHAAVAFCGDDAYDYDFGWRGGGQYWFSLQENNFSTGRAGEHDGASPDGQAPFSKPTIYNATYIGVGESTSASEGDAADALAFGILFRDNAAGLYANSIFANFNGAAVAIEDRADETANDSYQRMLAGDLKFVNNQFFNFGRGTGFSSIFLVVNENEEINSDNTPNFVTKMMTDGNQVVDPRFNGDDRDNDMYDYRPGFGSPAADAGEGTTVPAGFEAQDYIGAFAPGNGDDNASWLTDWTEISATQGMLNVTGVGQVESQGFILDAPVPNPASGITAINFELPRAATVTTTIVDILGRPVAQYRDEFAAGANSRIVSVANLPAGNYVVVVNAGNSRLMQKLVVRH